MFGPTTLQPWGRLCFFLAIAFAGSAHAQLAAQNSTPLSLGAYMQRVVEYNEALQARLLAFHAARSQRKAEGGTFEPSWVTTGEYVDNKKANTVEVERYLRTGGIFRNSAGVVFDYYSPTNFKFAALVAGTNQVVIGHYVKDTWVIDATASRTITAGTDYSISILLKGTTVSVNVNGQAALGYAFNAVVTDGQAGLFTRGGPSSFSNYLVKTDDPKLQGVVIASTTTVTATSESLSLLTASETGLQPSSSTSTASW